MYLLRSADCLTLVDTGPRTREAEAALEAGLREVGVQVEDLDQILLTHYHCDHVGLLEQLVERSQAKVYAHPFTEPLIAREAAFEEARGHFYRDLYRGMGLNERQQEQALGQILDYLDYVGVAHVDVALQEGACLPGHEAWNVLYTPGHALDHLSLYNALDGVMLLGDHLIKHISSNAFLEPPHSPGGERPKMLMLYRESLQKVQQLDWQIGYTGHGEEITEYRELITKRLNDMERRAEAVLETVRAGKHTGVDITLSMFPRHLEQIPLIISETVGHLDWLVAQGRLRVEESAELWHYEVVQDHVKNRRG